jgi:hypothetical protein
MTQWKYQYKMDAPHPTHKPLLRAMPPSHPQTTGASDTTKTFAEKGELLKERALKRAERAEARRVKAEEHKEAVCSITSGCITISRQCTFSGKCALSQGRVPRGYRGIRSRYPDTWPQCQVPLEHGRGMAEAKNVRFAPHRAVPPNDV